MLSPEAKAWIDSASLYDLIYRRRYAPSGDVMFSSPENYKYFQDRLELLKKQSGDNGVSASKAVGWG